MSQISRVIQAHLNRSAVVATEEHREENVSMAHGTLGNAHEAVKEIIDMIRQLPEDVDLEPWVVSKITLAEDYVDTVRDYLKQRIGGQSGSEEEGHGKSSARSVKAYMEHIELGPTPYAESCEQLGPNYDTRRARVEAKAFINQLIREHGQPPDGASFRITSNPHDFGSYLDVVIKFNDDNKEATAYAFKLENEGPEHWDAEAKSELAREFAKLGQDKSAGYEVLPPIDPDKFPNRERQGLEGPFRLLSGLVVYYDRKAGHYYNPLTDIYLSHEEHQAHQYYGKRATLKEVDEFTVCGHMLSALVNNDYSGLEDDEEKALRSFEKRLVKQHGGKPLNFVPEDDDPEFARCDVTNLYGNVVTVKVLA